MGEVMNDVETAALACLFIAEARRLVRKSLIK
jgi:hypothetical protein